MKFETSIVIHAGNPQVQDRAELFQMGDQVALVVADGAGGISGGAEAADRFLHEFRESRNSLFTPDDCCQLLTRIDQRLETASVCGETTGVIAIIDRDRVFGASVGDSIAWYFSRQSYIELTRNQKRKPFLGSGLAVPSAFSISEIDGTIVVATDGLWKYTGFEQIENEVRKPNVSNLAEELCGLVRLRSGGFPDDVAILTCRCTPGED
jgi:serine/threonine protein phosphatase PrpC